MTATDATKQATEQAHSLICQHRSQRARDTAFAILRRMQQLDTARFHDLEDTVQRERAALGLYIQLLDGPYLTPEGLDRIEGAIGLSELWVDIVQSGIPQATARPA